MNSMQTINCIKREHGVVDQLICNMLSQHKSLHHTITQPPMKDTLNLSTKDKRLDHMTVCPLFGGPTCVVLTGSPMVTSPYNLTTFRCENWPMMAASWRSLTCSMLDVSGGSCLMASTKVSLETVHSPLDTVPN